MSGYIDLRDIIRDYDEDDEECEETQTYYLWKEALEGDGIDIERQARNNPIFIPEDEWEEYAQELAEEIGAIDRNGRWPNNCIDWEKAARELASDYSQVKVGATYYYYNL